MSEPQAANSPVDVITRNIRGFFLMLIVVGLGLMISGAMPVIDAISAREWPSTQGMIVSSDVKIRTSRGKTVRTPRVVYQYTVNEVPYQGERVSFGTGFAPGRPTPHAITARYWEGKAVEVFYDPADPSQSVLERTLDAWMFAMSGLGLFLFLLGFVVFRKTGQGTAAIRQYIPQPVSRGGKTFLDGLIRAPLPSAKPDDAARGTVSAQEHPPRDFLPQGPPQASEIERAMSRRDPSPWSTPGPAFLAPGSESEPAWRRLLKIMLWFILAVLVILYAFREGWFGFK